MSDHKALRTLSKKPSPQESSQEYFEPAKAASARENIEKADRERTQNEDEDEDEDCNDRNGIM